MIERIQTTFDCCDDCAHGQCIMARGFLAEVAALHDEVERRRDQFAAANETIKVVADERDKALAEVERLRGLIQGPPEGGEVTDERTGPFGDAPTLMQSLIRERDRYKDEAIALRAEVERLTKIIQDLEDPHQAALDAARTTSKRE